jgi:hypothetical protein
MVRVGFILRVGLIGLLLSSCSAQQKSVPGQTPWRGTTTQEIPTINFKVQRGTITELFLVWALPLTEPCRVPTQASSESTAPRTKLDGNLTRYFNPYSPGNEPPKIAEKAWKTTIDGGGPGKVELVVTGTFTSETEASGTLEMTSKACQGSTRVAWKTIKQTKPPAHESLDRSKGLSSDFDGTWTGTIGDTKPIISFTVIGDAITEMTLEWILPLAEPCSTYPGSPMATTSLGGKSSWHFFPDSPGAEPPKIARKAWKSTVDASGSSKVQFVFTGAFTSETEASGTLEFTATDCKGSARAAWKATKQK